MKKLLLYIVTTASVLAICDTLKNMIKFINVCGYDSPFAIFSIYIILLLYINGVVIFTTLYNIPNKKRFLLSIITLSMLFMILLYRNSFFYDNKLILISHIISVIAFIYICFIKNKYDFFIKK